MNHFNYNLNSLINSDKNLNDIHFGSKINFCAYQIIETEHSPFIQYLLYKEQTSMEFDFPTYYVTNIDNHSLFIQVDKFLKNLLKDKMDKKFDIDQEIIYNGYIHCNNEYYFLYNLSSLKLDYKPLLFSFTSTWFVLMDEILNTKHVCGIQISDNITCLFEKYPDLIFLYNNENEIIKSPKIGYIGRIDKYLHFTYTFGVSKSLPNSLFGDLFYYTSFENSFNNNWIIQNYFEQDLESSITDNNSIFNLEGNTFTHGIVRSALFMNNTKVLNNIKVDKKDFTIDFDNKIIFTNPSVFELDDSWKMSFDSLVLTDLTLDPSKKYKGPPVIGLTELYQQYPLSYHYYKPSSNNTNII